MKRLAHILGAVLALSGCVSTGQICVPGRIDAEIARNSKDSLPKGCRSIGSASGISQLDCDDGRVGYAFSGSALQSLPSDLH